MCVPRPDSPSIFAADPRPGGRFVPGRRRSASRVPAARRYLPGTLVLETTWQTPTGWLVVRDALIMGPWHNTDERSETHRRSPTDYDAEHVLLRTDHVRQRHGRPAGRVRAGVRLRPREAAQWEYDGDGYHEVVAAPPEGSTPDAAADQRACGIGLEGRARDGPHPDGQRATRRYVALSWSDRCPRPTTWPRPPTPDVAHRASTGASGSPRASSPTTRGAPTCSAARSRSRA